MNINISKLLTVIFVEKLTAKVKGRFCVGLL